MSCALQSTGLIAERNPCLSDRVCKPCATKIRKISKSFKFTASELNVVNPKFIMPSNAEVDDTDVLPSTKRCLPTSVFNSRKKPRAEENSENLPKSDKGDKEKQ